MAKRKKSVSRKRSPKQLAHDRCLKTEFKDQKIALLKIPKNRKLTPRKLNQKVFSNSIQACKK